VHASAGRATLPRPVPSFRLISADGEDLGVLRAAAAGWTAGDRIQRGRGGDLVVVRLVVADPGDDVEGYLVVGPAPVSEHG
jgi:hypothetical protein